MHQLPELLKGLSLNEVEYKKLKEVCIINKGIQFNKSNMNDSGSYPVINGGISASGYIEQYNQDENTITVSQGGASAGYVNWLETKFWAGAHCYVLKPKDTVDNRYLYHFVKSQEHRLQECQYGAGIPALSKTTIEELDIPIPPLPVQHEIVKGLDTFTKLISKLTDELTARKQQFDYYINRLLLESENSQLVSLGDLAVIKTGTKPPTIYDEEKDYEYINAGTTNSGFTDEYNCEGDTITTPSRGQGGIGFVGYQKNPFWLGALCYRIQSKDKNLIANKYLYYYLSHNNSRILQCKREGGTPAVNACDLAKIEICVPPIETQRRIVDILDNFDTICNDSVLGLPAEIAARQKQYEYYRDKLLYSC